MQTVYYEIWTSPSLKNNVEAVVSRGQLTSHRLISFSTRPTPNNIRPVAIDCRSCVYALLWRLRRQLHPCSVTAYHPRSPFVGILFSLLSMIDPGTKHHLMISSIRRLLHLLTALGSYSDHSPSSISSFHFASAYCAVYSMRISRPTC